MEQRLGWEAEARPTSRPKYSFGPPIGGVDWSGGCGQTKTFGNRRKSVLHSQARSETEGPKKREGIGPVNIARTPTRAVRPPQIFFDKHKIEVNAVLAGADVFAPLLEAQHLRGEIEIFEALGLYDRELAGDTLTEIDNLMECRLFSAHCRSRATDGVLLGAYRVSSGYRFAGSLALR